MSVERNSKHGVQLSSEDKQRYARKKMAGVGKKNQGERIKQIAKTLSVSPRMIRTWTANQRKDAEAEQKQQVAGLWLACYTQDEIAEKVGMPQRSVTDAIKKFSESGNFANLAKLFKAKPDHVADESFDGSLYNVWGRGKLEDGLVDNLLYHYTEPLDVVMDPFGGGSTIDVCKRRLRRYYVSDLTPSPERENEIRQHDIATGGLPKPPQWKDVKLVYLSPPRWKGSEQDFEAYQQMLFLVVRGFADKLHAGAHVALTIQPTQSLSDEELTWYDHFADLMRPWGDLSLGMPVQRIQVPCDTKDCSTEMVEWAKTNRQALCLSREIVVWRVAQDQEEGA